MKIWHYDRVTKELVGEGVADENPLEAGEWLLPAFTTSIAPPDKQAGVAAVFNGAWSTVPDHRGETWWKIGAVDNSEPVVIDYLGEPADLTKAEPPAPVPPVVPLSVSPRQIRLALNQLGLRAAVEAYVLAADQDVKDSWQFAADFDRDHSMVATAGAALGKTSDEIDALFELAKTL